MFQCYVALLNRTFDITMGELVKQKPNNKQTNKEEKNFPLNNGFVM
jgi:hypothetical protein